MAKATWKVVWMGKNKACMEEFACEHRARRRAKELREYLLSPEYGQTVQVISPKEPQPEKTQQKALKI